MIDWETLKTDRDEGRPWLWRLVVAPHAWQPVSGSTVMGRNATA